MNQKKDVHRIELDDPEIHAHTDMILTTMYDYGLSLGEMKAVGFQVLVKLFLMDLDLIDPRQAVLCQELAISAVLQLEQFYRTYPLPEIPDDLPQEITH